MMKSVHIVFMISLSLILISGCTGTTETASGQIDSDTVYECKVGSSGYSDCISKTFLADSECAPSMFMVEYERNDRETGETLYTFTIYRHYSRENSNCVLYEELREVDIKDEGISLETLGVEIGDSLTCTPLQLLGKEAIMSKSRCTGVLFGKSL